MSSNAQDTIVLNQTVNETFEPLFTRKTRYFILMGGRGAGRSTAASQFAFAKLMSDGYFRCAIMRFILGDIRNSIYREIIDRAEDQGARDVLDISDNAMVIKYGMNSINAVGFRKSSGDQKSKLKSLANYNTVIIEEAEEIPEADFMQLDDSLRTVKGDINIILMLNPPPKSHWIIQRWFDLEKVSEAPGFYKPKLKPEFQDVTFINTCYLDNIKNLSDQTVTNYERYKQTNPSHYWNMVRGLVPEVVRGKIYNGWRIIDAIPHGARFECFALDFGYHPDPAAVVAIYYLNGEYILDQVAYANDMLNRHIANVIKNYGKGLVVADHAEPKSIDELIEFGLDVVPCEKGSDSVDYGIKKVQGLKISVTRRSTKIWKEYDNYAWKVDKEGNDMGIVDPNCDDHAMDAVRYGLSFLKPADPLEERIQHVERIARNRDREEETRQNAGL